MWGIVATARCPDDKQRHAFEDSYALEPSFSIARARIFQREQLAVEETVQILKVNAVVRQIPETFVLVPGDQGAHCICKRICTQEGRGPLVALGFCIGPACLSRAGNGRPYFSRNALIKESISGNQVQIPSVVSSQVPSPARKVGDVGGGCRGVGLAQEAGHLVAAFQLNPADAEGSRDAGDKRAETGRRD